jgi:hypothetical protein
VLVSVGLLYFSLSLGFKCLIKILFHRF